ncbi:MAG TPA: CerR family C-terminal domain-containing protein [Steroidobacteraceae bacterium]|nr:CerR family C-terminal domain-containing protein [Steroidobacteraceae bacterium]
MKRVSRRRPKTGGYPRGDETRAHIVTVALKVFGERGFDLASTRDIAAKAGVKTPALQYYFDGKEGLHLACAQYVLDKALPKLKPSLERAIEAAQNGSDESARSALEDVLDSLTNSLGDPSTESWIRFVARSKHDGAGPGVELIRKTLSYPILEAAAGLVEKIAGEKSREVARLRTLLILGQIHWMNASRTEALKVMRWSKLDAVKLTLIKEMVREHTRLALGGAQ